MYGYEHGMNGWGYAVMAFGSLAFWALVVIAAMALFRRPAAGPHSPEPSAEQVLAERFARGEIDDDGYYRRLAVLEQGRRPQDRKG